DAATLPNRLQINWGPGNRFHLGEVTSALCTDDPAIVSAKPRAVGFDTYDGSGTGQYNGQPGATITWRFTDAGEPGRNDYASIVIKDAGGNIVLVVTGTLNNGNHQAHNDKLSIW
ncbi:MAG TPA: hypothetical protein VJ691_09690, partial [Vicinamibacterales bacterium]|nr:hypothetical protein [Vicinamibacterales bacterium]